MTASANKEFLASHGIKYTNQRDIVLTILKELKKPITVEDLYLKVTNLQPSINLSTIYRILETFHEKGIVIKNGVSEDKKNVYELSTDAHKHYMVCVKCRRVFPIENCPCELLEQMIEKNSDFEIVDHKIEVLGYCSQCKKSF